MKRAMFLLSVLIINFNLCASELATTIDEVSMVQLDNGLEILTSEEGISLYTFDVDPAGESACFGQCLVVWPPLLTEKDELPEPFSIHIRPDGAKQVMLNGQPLYFFIQDKAAGDIRGDGVGGVWHLITL